MRTQKLKKMEMYKELTLNERLSSQFVVNDDFHSDRYFFRKYNHAMKAFFHFKEVENFCVSVVDMSGKKWARMRDNSDGYFHEIWTDWWGGFMPQSKLVEEATVQAMKTTKIVGTLGSALQSNFNTHLRLILTNRNTTLNN